MHSKGHEDRKGDRKWIVDINIQREARFLQSVTLHKGISQPHGNGTQHFGLLQQLLPKALLDAGYMVVNHATAQHSNLPWD